MEESESYQENNHGFITLLSGKTTHINHPCTKWAMQSWRNYIWLRDLLLMLGLEYMYRFGKPHKTYEVLRYPLYYPPETLVQDTFTLPALAMPDEHKPKGDYISQHQAVHSYRDFYLTKKESFKRGQPKWTKRQPPTWWKD